MVVLKLRLWEEIFDVFKLEVIVSRLVRFMVSVLFLIRNFFGLRELLVLFCFNLY